MRALLPRRKAGIRGALALSVAAPSEREAAAGEDVLKQAEAVTHDAVHAEVEKLLHRCLLVDRPDVDGQTHTMRGRDEPLGDDRKVSSANRHLDAIGAQARHPAGRCGEASEHDQTRSHRRACPSAAERAEPTNAAVRERADAYALPCAEPVEESDKRPDASVRLGVNIDADTGPTHQDLLEPGDPNATTTEREAAPTVRGEPIASIRGFHLDDAELGNRAPAIRDSVKAVVVEGDQHAVARDVGIGLHVSVPKCHSDRECRDRVLGRLAGTAAVRERDWAGTVEERVHTCQFGAIRARSLTKHQRSRSAETATVRSAPLHRSDASGLSPGYRRDRPLRWCDS